MRELDLYIVKDGKKLRCGYTTGSCATAASKAAVLLLEGRLDTDFISIDTPKGIELKIDIEWTEKTGNHAIAAVKKDAGDDPDITDGLEIIAKAKRRIDNNINIDGGEGVGRITIDGFWGKSGDAAINPAPRKMIESEIKSISNSGYDIEIIVPKGREIGKKTFNQNIGILDGISIIGTTGIVEPMSEDAFKKCIFMEIDNIVSDKRNSIVLYPGNYGEKLGNELFPDLKGVQIANFVGESVLYCQMKGIDKIILLGHIGKFSKLSLGAFNTHSKICDMRIEAFIYYLGLRGDFKAINDIKKFRTSEEVIKYLKSEDKMDLIEDMRDGCIKRVKTYMKDEDYDIEVIIYSMEYGVIS
ncbi:MAG: cobalt-precorrin-5B (C(1))-methyltransferase CbiD [Andreesenia angusta]|nr:cobalt-precorrin-5B (C(1))-methyltransferase CbiD [Andreesenia angusta]